MDSAVSLVEAYLRGNGYFTVTEYPVAEAMGGPGPGYRVAADLDALRGYVVDHWTVLRHAYFKDPAFAFLVLQEKARRSSS